MKKKSKLVSPYFAVALHAAALTLAALTLSCSSNAKKTDMVPAEQQKPEMEAAYEALIERYSAGEAKYSGFYNNFEYRATLLNSAVREGILQRRSEYYQWNREKALAEKDKADKEMAGSTVAFMAFFTPERRNDNLTDEKSIWRVYLDVGGQRYSGKVKKVKSLITEVQSLYPYHTRWTTAYELSFPVPTPAVETQSANITVTGPLGTRVVQFPPVAR